MGVLKNFAIFTGKHLCWNLFFDKVAGFVSWSKKEIVTQVFFCEYSEIFRSSVLHRIPTVAASVISIHMLF